MRDETRNALVVTDQGADQGADQQRIDRALLLWTTEAVEAAQHAEAMLAGLQKHPRLVLAREYALLARLRDRMKELLPLLDRTLRRGTR